MSESGMPWRGERAVASGMQARVANMVFDMFKGSRHISARGAVAQPRRGHHGLVAGCAFAKDLLKPFIGQMKRECPGGRPRDCVGDITLQVQGDIAQGCAAQMHEKLDKLKGALRRENMVHNDSKAQLLGLTEELRQAWERNGTSTKVAQDLGVSQY